MFFNPKMTSDIANKRLLWQHLTTIVIEKIHKMSVKGVKLKSESFFFNISWRLKLWRKNLKGADSAPPPAWIGLNKPYQTVGDKDQNFYNREVGVRSQAVVGNMS